MKRSAFMKPGKPMQRGTGFAHKALRATPAERALIIHQPLIRAPNYASCTVRLPVPKRDYVRSPTLRESYRLIPCQWPGCGLDDGTVCCAHSNWAVHGKGKSRKASDDRGASLCAAHHSALDQGSAMSRDERQAGWWAAHVNSVALLVALGHWPAVLPVPDTIVSPWDTE